MDMDLPTEGIELLVHLRHLDISGLSGNLPSSICKLWSLQTLIYHHRCYYPLMLPPNISNLVNLRHFSCFSLNYEKTFHLPLVWKTMMNLQTISCVGLRYEVHNFGKCRPYIKELTCTANKEKYINDFKYLTYLEKLHVTGPLGRRQDDTAFPATLKTIKLTWCRLPWSHISIIQSLPNLQVLKLESGSFSGRQWNTDGQKFPKLKFLRLKVLNIQVWKAYTTSFPCLKQLEIRWCRYLKEIPLEIGDIPTLELIKISACGQSVGESVGRIEEEQQDLGNYDLKIHITEDI